MATTTVAPRTAAYPRSRVYEWLTTTDHKKIGVLYISTRTMIGAHGPERGPACTRDR